MFAADFDGLVADGSLPAAPVHPDTFYPCCDAVIDNRFRDRRRCHQQHSVDGRRYVLDASETLCPITSTTFGFTGTTTHPR